MYNQLFNKRSGKVNKEIAMTIAKRHRALMLEITRRMITVNINYQSGGLA